MMHLLTNPVRNYAWGSTRHLARFLGREETGRPEAELWIGAHEGDPSLLDGGHRLDRAISDDPIRLLGERVVAEHGARLPFLMKVLAIGGPLSLQVHPTAEQARRGHAEEQRQGVPVGAAHRNYRDPWHKPELVYALTRFEGMAGFRDPIRTSELLGLLGHPWAARTALDLTSGPPDRALRSVTTSILTMSRPEVRQLLLELVPAVRSAAARAHDRERTVGLLRSRRDSEEAAVRREAIRVFELFPTLSEPYPDDPGVLVALLLNHLVLAPGEAMFVGPGVIHAYASGLGVEIMAASDNVLRAGLTPKHKDVPEVLAVTDFRSSPSARFLPSQSAGSTQWFRPAVDDFALAVTSSLTLEKHGPVLVLALDEVKLMGDGDEQGQTLARGQAAFIPAGRHLNVNGRCAVGTDS